MVFFKLYLQTQKAIVLKFWGTSDNLWKSSESYAYSSQKNAHIYIEDIVLYTFSQGLLSF